MAAQGTPPLRIDPATGRKLFNTRAAKASARIEGKGYDVVTEEELIGAGRLERLTYRLRRR